MRTANAVLVYNLPIGVLVEDEQTGNLTPSLQKITLKAFLRQNSVEAATVRTPQDDYYGIAVNAMPFVGRLIDPVYLPPEIKPYQPAKAKIDQYFGVFYLVPLVQSELVTFIRYRVLKGWLVLDNSTTYLDFL